MGRSSRRGPWLPEEDEALLGLVHRQGPNNWVRISHYMEHRSPKQCRERFHQNLKPSLNHEPISPEEGEAIEQLVQDMGKRWAEIARRLGNRSDNAVKNWWNGSMNRRKRHHAPTGVITRGVGPRAHPIPNSSPPQPDTSFSPRFNLDAGRRPAFAPHPHLTLPSLPQLDVESHQRNMGLQQPYLRMSEIRSLPPAFEAQSAPASVQPMPDPFSLRSLHPQIDQSGLRPPPLESRHSYPSQWHRPPGLEPSAISPAVTEFSTIPPAHQAPSLISDNQSHYSISPKTVSSPRPSLPAPIDTSTTRMYYPEQRRNSYTPYTTESKFYSHDEGYVSALPQSTTFETSDSRFPLDPSLEARPGQQETGSPAGTRIHGRTLSSPNERDSRMNVSSLLE